MTDLPTSVTLDQARLAAQLEQTQLQNEKLRLDLAELRKGRPWSQWFTQLIPIITAVIAIAGFWIGLFRYQAEQSQATKREEERRERDFMKPWLDSQRDFYQQSLSAAVTIATSSDPKKVSLAADEFWQLYFGKMIFVESKDVAQGMVRFGECLRDPACKENLSRLSLNLAGKMAASMIETSKMTYDDFAKIQLSYASTN